MILHNETKGNAEKLKEGPKIADSEFSCENPYETLVFRNKIRRKKNNNSLRFNFLLILLIVTLITSSILLNNFFTKSLDPVIFKLLSFPHLVQEGNILSPKDFVMNQIKKPYVLTIGEFGNSALAKDEASKLLPKFKEITIKQLDTGIYVFEIERFSSKKNAYLAAGEFIQDGLDSVHVRYLPDQ